MLLSQLLGSLQFECEPHFSKDVCSDNHTRLFTEGPLDSFGVACRAFSCSGTTELCRGYFLVLGRRQKNIGPGPQLTESPVRERRQDTGQGLATEATYILEKWCIDTRPRSAETWDSPWVLETLKISPWRDLNLERWGSFWKREKPWAIRAAVAGKATDLSLVYTMWADVWRAEGWGGALKGQVGKRALSSPNLHLQGPGPPFFFFFFLLSFWC